jgi:hypothetical protein
MDDFKLGWRMFTKGKLKLFPSRVREKKEIKDAFHSTLPVRDRR